MSEYIRTINSADAIGNLWREGSWPAVLAVEALTGLGFYGLSVTERAIAGYLNGVRFEVGANANA